MEAVWPRRELKGSSAASREPGETDCWDLIVKNNSTLLYFHNVMIKRNLSAAALSAPYVKSVTRNGSVLVHTGLCQSVQPSTVWFNKTLYNVDNIFKFKCKTHHQIKRVEATFC